MFKRILLLLLICILFVSAFCGVVGVWGYYYVTRDLPQLSTIEDYKPPAVSRLYSSDGVLLAEFYTERRYPVKIKDVPDIVKKSFLAAEDAEFYTHGGIDPTSIIRALVKNIQSGNARQGGSTITQQVVKNLLLTPEKKITRKIKEAILSYRLEKRFSKDEIFEIYLNQIFFGNSAYGVRAAARLYFHKELPELTLAESAMLAGLPKAPTSNSPLANPKAARLREEYVLQQMVRANFITQDQMKEAVKQEIKVYPASQQNVFAAPYFVGEIRREFSEKWRDWDLDNDGLEVTATVDSNADRMSLAALRKGLREVDKRRGWRGARGHTDGGSPEYMRLYGNQVPSEFAPEILYPALVKTSGSRRSTITVQVGPKDYELKSSDSGWAKKNLHRDDSVSFGEPFDDLRPGDIIDVSLPSPEVDAKGATKQAGFVLDQTPDVEGAAVLIDPFSGEIKTMVGGYDYNRSQFNRVTQSLRQPGSAFKPVVYLSAIDKFNYTPATIVHDEPRTFRVGDTLWTPGNFDEKFLGAITLRTALEKSRNLVSADIVSRIGVDAPIQYARSLGIQSPLGRNLSLSLGSSEVTPLEMTRAYGVFSAGGILFDSVFISKIKDRTGKVIFDYEAEKAKHGKQVIDKNSAFIMANMMKGVVENGTGYKVKALGRPVAGKTGTSNDQMDAWFIGYTPQWVYGVWVGFDQKKQIGPKETGGVVSAPVWLYFMQNFLKSTEDHELSLSERDIKEEAKDFGINYVPPVVTKVIDFPVPDGVEPLWIYKSSGARAEPGAEGAFLEYFKKGTEPQKVAHEEGASADEVNSYLDMPDL